MTWLADASVQHVLAAYGPWAIFAIVMLESSGLPLPAESLLLAAVVLSATTHDMSLASIVTAAALGAIVGDNIGYLIGRRIGGPLLQRYGPRVGLSERRLRLGRYLFARHGGLIVVTARFIAFLRTLAALLAGANHMPWPRFLVYNALGGILWAVVYCVGGYLVGTEIRRVSLPLAIVGILLGAGLVLLLWRWLKRAEARLQAEAERAGEVP